MARSTYVSASPTPFPHQTGIYEWLVYLTDGGLDIHWTRAGVCESFPRLYVAYRAGAQEQRC